MEIEIEIKGKIDISKICEIEMLLFKEGFDGEVIIIPIIQQNGTLKPAKQNE